MNVKKTKSSKKIVLKITMSMTVSRYVAPFSAAPSPFNTRVTKLGLIDPDDPTKEEDGSHVDKGNTSSMAGVLDSPTQLIRRPSLLIDWDDECGSNR